MHFQALQLLEERHGSVVRETYETGVVKKWQEDNHAHGAFVIQNAFQRVDLMVKYNTYCRGGDILTLDIFDIKKSQFTW